tara:strand:- start:56684 stop:59368 length:2685 start_codon:yes stop_codon:yes gene_type:complete
MRIIKKLIIITTIIGTLLFSILVVFGFIYQDEVVDSVTTEINKQLNAEIKVATIDLSFISNFPLASVTLHHVVGFESKNYTSKPDTLFEFEAFSLSFNIIDILNQSYVLNSIEAHEGFLNLEMNRAGEGNFEIFVTDTSNTDKFELDLESVTLVNCAVGFTDFSTTDAYQFYFPKIIAKGAFKEEWINTALYGTVDVQKLSLDGTSYLQNETAHVDLGLTINTETGYFQISRGFLTLREAYDFEVKGKTNSDGFAYTFESKSLNLKEIETLIPKKHIQFIKAYNINGEAAVFMALERTKNASHPAITGRFNVVNGVLTYLQTGERVTVSHAKGTFDLGRLANPTTTTIDIPEFGLSTHEGSASGSFLLRNLKHPKYQVHCKGIANLLEISKLADLGENFKMSGSAEFEVKVSGSVQNMDSILGSDVETMRGKAKVSLKEGAFEIADIPSMSHVNVDLEIDRNKVAFNDLNGNIADSQIKASGVVNNWLGYLLGKSKQLAVHANVTTQKLDVADWAAPKETDKQQDFSFTDKVAFQGSVEIGNFKMDELIISNINTDVVFANQSLHLGNLYCNAFGGEIVANFKMNQWANGFGYSGNLKTKSVKLKRFLVAFKNFDQKVLTDKEINGDFNCNLIYNFTSNKQLEINTESINLDGDVIILNGELIEYKLLYDIPKQIESNRIIKLFVNLDQFEKRLHHIKFDTISNHITIANSVITIPRMDIHSSALTISLQGTHSFTNELDYFMDFNLKQVLSKKKPITSEYGYIQDDGLGNRMIYLHVYTKNGEIEVDLDKLGSSKGLRIQSSEEMKVAKSILKEELGLFKKDTSVVVEEKPEEFNYEVDLGEFSDSIPKDTAVVADSTSTDSTLLKKLLKKKKSKKAKKEDDFEEWDFDDEDY